MAEHAPLHAFQSLVMADPESQAALAGCVAPADFEALAREIAARAGLALPAEAFEAALRPDPAGLHLYDEPPLAGAAWPGAGWRPAQVVGESVDWLHFAGDPLDSPLFADSVRRAAARPFNRLFRYRMTLDDFVGQAPADIAPPAGLIFHLSRCGSTLVQQMLAAVPGVAAISEPAPLDSMVKRGDPAALRAMAGALGRGSRLYAFKLDSWHMLELPLLRRAFPGVPWIFLHRDPVEILVALMGTPIAEIAPARVPPERLGLAYDPDAPAEDYAARVLARLIEAAADGRAEGGGLAIDYRDLPGAIEAILGHFGLDAGGADLAQVARRDAKLPERAFAGDSERKQAAATDSVRAAAERHVAPAYRRLARML